MKVQIVDRREIERLLPAGAVHQGVALLADPPPEPDIEDVLSAAADRATLVVLDQATDPRNIGAVLRAAAAFDAAAVIMPERHAPGSTGVLAKAASGALETVPLVRVTNLARALERLKEAGFWCVGLDGDGTVTIAEADLAGRLALVLGAEGAGLRRLTREHCDLVVRIPISQRIESLNLATAAAIALYEVARRTP
jgi:23S rRNA (guanosine2251-2'-O)-methyltransferase